MNLYGFVGNDGVNRWDWLGLRYPTLEDEWRDTGGIGTSFSIGEFRREYKNSQPLPDYFDYLTIDERENGLSNGWDTLPTKPNASPGDEPTELNWGENGYECCSSRVIANGRKLLVAAGQKLINQMEAAWDKEQNGEWSCTHCNSLLQPDIATELGGYPCCWTCYLENRRIKSHKAPGSLIGIGGVVDHSVVICYAVNSSGQVVDSTIFDATGGQTGLPVSSFRSKWDRIWFMRNHKNTPTPCRP